MSILNNPLYRGLIITGIALLLIFVGYVAVFQPKQNEIAASEAQLDSLRAQLAELKRVADQKPQYLALTRQIQQRLTGVELTADTRAYIPTYLKQIEDLAKRDGLAVTAVTPVAPTPSPSPTGSASPNPNAVASSVPAIGAVAHVAGGPSANAVNEAGGTTGGATEAPAAGSSGPAPSPSASGVPGPIVNNPRLNAITYVEQSFTQVPVNMEMEGTFANFERFLRDLNKFPKLIGVGNATLSLINQSALGVTPKLKITLPITAYRLGPSAFSVRTRNGLINPPRPSPTPSGQGG